MEEKAVNVELLIRRTPEAVFQALTDPELVKIWWRSPDFYEVTDFEMDDKPGGNWSLKALGYNGKPFKVHGKLLEYDPPQEIAFTWNPSWQTLPTTTVRILLQPVPEGVMLRLVHSGFRSDSTGYEAHLYGWPHVIEWLARFLHAKMMPNQQLSKNDK